MDGIQWEEGRPRLYPGNVDRRGNTSTVLEQLLSFEAYLKISTSQDIRIERKRLEMVIDTV
jgi:hypothetical protein